jgi:hypothetical protein
MVYGVFGGCYSDWYVVGYFNNRQDAEKYCCLCEENIYIYFFNVLRTAPGLLIISEKKVQTVSARPT